MRAAVMFLFLAVAGLVTFGLVMLYSSVVFGGDLSFLLRQLCWLGLGLLVCVFVGLWDYGWLRDWVWVLLLLALVMLVLVFVPGLGREVNGAHRWLAVGGFGFQPSEFGKLAMVVFLAWYGDRYGRFMGRFWRGLVLPCLVVGLLLGLVFVEPDRGTAILLGAVAVVMLLVAGARWFYVLPPLVLGVVLVGLSLWLDPVRNARLRAWVDPEAMRDGAGYQVWSSLLALGSGGLDGLGLGNGRRKHGFLPFQETDFIFAVIGEELGLLASLGVVLVFVVLVVSGLFIAVRARDNFGFLLGSGVTFLIGLQAFINIGVATNTLPSKGLALPFVSYGGSSLVMMLVCFGVLVSVARGGYVEGLGGSVFGGRRVAGVG